MYLTDYREETLKDVIMQLERDLFTKVTGLTIQDFEKLVVASERLFLRKFFINNFKHYVKSFHNMSEIIFFIQLTVPAIFWDTDLLL